MGGFAFEQLPLAVRLQDEATFDNFYTSEQNELAVNVLQHIASGGDEWFVYLHGPQSSGRSHLLQAACHGVSNAVSSIYLPLSELHHYSPDELFQGLEQCGLIALDDLDAVAGEPHWEEALFHLYNRCQLGGVKLMVAASLPPSALPLKLPDLRSRLEWGMPLKISPLNDEERIAALQFRAARRGMTLGEDVARYLYTHVQRDSGEIFRLLDRLDNQSLVQQRRLTIPFVKSVLGDG